MKSILLSLISFYQAYLSLPLRLLTGSSASCRFQTTCSVYAQQVIKKHGVLLGGKMAIARLLSCQPFGNSQALAGK